MIVTNLLFAALLFGHGRHVRREGFHRGGNISKALFLQHAELAHSFEAIHHLMSGCWYVIQCRGQVNNSRYRQIEVQQDDIVLVAAHERQGYLSIAGLLYMVPVSFKCEPCSNNQIILCYESMISC